MERSDSDDESEPESKPTSQQLHGLKLDLHTLDVHSEEFLSLPPDVRHDILSELKETRKQNSWGRLHEMPEVLNILTIRRTYLSRNTSSYKANGMSNVWIFVQ